MKIDHPNGKKVEIIIEKMSAMEGWNIQRRFVEFAMSKDPSFRSEYTMEVLSFAKIQIAADSVLPLSTGALIDNHLGNWKNLEAVFNEVLLTNGIDPATHAEREDYWTKAGGELALSFIGETIRLIEPFMAGNQSNKE